MMHSASASEYGEWQRWSFVPLTLAFVAQLFFVRFYLGTVRWWLFGTFLLMRVVVLAVDFSVQPNFNFVSIDSLSHLSFLGEQVSVIGEVVLRTRWQLFALASLVVWTVFLVDAATKRWRQGGKESRRKALAVLFGLALPVLCNVAYAQLLVFRGLHLPLTNLPWLLGALLTMGYELGRDFVLSRRARLELTGLQGKLTHAERVSSLGQLASTLAHELTQPLAASLANVQSAQIHLRKANPNLQELRAIVDDIGKDHRHAADVVARMRQFFERGTIEMLQLNIADVVQDVVSLVHSEATSKNVALHLRIESNLPPVLGDRVHLSQVLLNLVMNGIQAVQSRPLDARIVVVDAHACNDTDEVEIAVRDSGPGIPNTIGDEVFKPFFTTKSDGMGMGLTLSRSIIETHGGRLWTDHSGDGATFRFTLPRG
jgi:signal transduction histidine kinase